MLDQTNKLQSLEQIKNHPEIKLWILVENVRSAYNVGAMFRTADGTGQTGLILVGYTPDATNPKVPKTSLGAEKTVKYVSWHETEKLSVIEIVSQIKNLGITVAGLELSVKATDLYEYVPSNYPLVLCVGNEVEGLSVELMQQVDLFIQIPMNGAKQSLNVAEAASIAMYEFFRKVKQS